MNTYLKSLSITSVFLAASFSAQASNSHPLHDEIRFYEYSITQSSVSATLSEANKAEKLDLLVDARRQVDLGHYRTAEGILKKVAQNLYRMSAEESGQRAHTVKSVQASLQAIASILPQAQLIALEKKAGQETLNQVMLGYQDAKFALETNDLGKARLLAQKSYRMLKENVAELRSGELLLIELPATDSREGWMDAAQRYLDWRYFNRQLESAMKEKGLNTNIVNKASVDADQIYDLATNIALQGDWQQAVATVDQAYHILEQAWTNVGVDIGT